MKKYFLTAVLLAFSPSAWAADAAAIASVVTEAPAGTYTLDKAHASLIFKVDHSGFSHYTARFKRFDATLTIDPANPSAAMLTAMIDPSSLETDYPEPEKLDFNAQLQNDQWLDTAKFPKMTYQSTKIEMTGANTALVYGDLDLHGVKKPVILNATFNGGYTGYPPYDPNARIGFSAKGELMRSDFGLVYGIPEAGSKMGVSDKVEFTLEVEFSGPPTPEAAAAK